MTIRREDGADSRVEIAKLNGTLRQLLAESPIITPRPRNFDFKAPESPLTLAADVPDFEQVTISTTASVQPTMVPGRTGFPLLKSDSISTAIPIGGKDQWVAVGVFSRSSSRSGGETKLYWASPRSNKVVDGPVFLDDERIVDYSAEQSRLLNVQIGGYWGQPVRFCTYRVAVGESVAQTYQLTSFGRYGGSQTEEHTVTPWVQKAEIRYKDKVAWSTGAGGVPSFVSFKEGGSLGGELQKSSSPGYYLFDDLKLPDELLYPKYQRGLGTTQITIDGFVDKVN